MANLFDLTGKNAMIIGGAGGLGKLVAKAFAEAGANVAIASRTESKLAAACDEGMIELFEGDWLDELFSKIC